jgi:hypothetical protein
VRRERSAVGSGRPAREPPSAVSPTLTGFQ